MPRTGARGPNTIADPIAKCSASTATAPMPCSPMDTSGSCENRLRCQSCGPWPPGPTRRTKLPSNSTDRSSEAALLCVHRTRVAHLHSWRCWGHALGGSFVQLPRPSTLLALVEKSSSASSHDFNTRGEDEQEVPPSWDCGRNRRVADRLVHLSLRKAQI